MNDMTGIETPEIGITITVSRPNGDSVTGTIAEVLSQSDESEMASELVAILDTVRPFVQRALLNTREHRHLQRLESAIGSLASARDSARRSAAFEYGID